MFADSSGISPRFRPSSIFKRLQTVGRGERYHSGYYPQPRKLYTMKVYGPLEAIRHVSPSVTVRRAGWTTDFIYKANKSLRRETTRVSSRAGSQQGTERDMEETREWDDRTRGEDLRVRHESI